MAAIDQHPDLILRRDYELQRAQSKAHCRNCDLNDIRAKWERIAAERDRVAASQAKRRIQS